MNGLRILEFEPELVRAVPETWALLRRANLTVHARVRGVVLHGSRGLARCWRPDSDVDLTLLVERPARLEGARLEGLLGEVFETTLGNWRGAVEADLAVVFETRDCGLRCFEQRTWEERACTIGGVDCFGLFKRQRGFGGPVTGAGVEVRRMYPCLRIWQRIL